MSQTQRQLRSTYNNGQAYRIARGQAAPQGAVVDRFSTVHPVVSGFPSVQQFQKAFVRELKIRCYQPKTIRSYSQILAHFLRWFGNRPHRVTREDVRCFLEVLVDGGAKSDWISQNLAVIRTAFDKFNGRQVTLGLATPRKPKRLPVILSEDEVRGILKAATSLRDKLLIGLMYATGMRISEVTRLRWQDIDFERRVVSVWQAKGRSDRQVTLPESFTPLLGNLAKQFAPNAYIFPGDKAGRHISPRTGERIVARTVALTPIRKRVTPHSFRHAFATHLLEHGTDIRFIQKLLGHVRLETTTIYTRVAVPRDNAITSPLDRVASAPDPNQHKPQANAGDSRPQTKLCGGIRIKLNTRTQHTAEFDIEVYSHRSPHTLTLPNIVVTQKQNRWLTVELPPDEQWADQLELLDEECRTKVRSHEFYQRLQTELTHRYLTTHPT